MFALSREGTFGGPLQMYLLFGEIDRGRPPQARLTPETVRLLAAKFARFSDQYTMFSEFKKLDNASITRFLSAAQALDRIPDRIVRADAMGIMQANVGLWQILARQGQIPEARWNESWQQMLAPFSGIGIGGPAFRRGPGLPGRTRERGHRQDPDLSRRADCAAGGPQPGKCGWAADAAGAREQNPRRDGRPAAGFARHTFRIAAGLE